MYRIILAAALLCALTISADARQRQKSTACAEADIMRPVCGMGRDFLEGVKSIKVTMRRERRAAVERVSETAGQRVAAQVVGGRPTGCPHRFCGCGASLHLFGRIIPSLNLAANWLRFPRATPAPNMVAARRGHVFVLKEHLGGDRWLAFDANSGRHMTRIHARSIDGYTVVNPHGAV